MSGISHVACRVACEQQMYFLSWLNSLPLKNNVCEPERQNDFHDTEYFALMLANQNKGWNTARVTPHDLARLRVLDFGKSYQNNMLLEHEFHDNNKVSCDVEC